MKHFLIFSFMIHSSPKLHLAHICCRRWTKHQSGLGTISMSLTHVCRLFFGFLFLQELLNHYEWQVIKFLILSSLIPYTWWMILFGLWMITKAWFISFFTSSFLANVIETSTHCNSLGSQFPLYLLNMFYFFSVFFLDWVCNELDILSPVESF